MQFAPFQNRSSSTQTRTTHTWRRPLPPIDQAVPHLTAATDAVGTAPTAGNIGSRADQRPH